MGKIEAEASIHHFSHLHPLTLISIHSSTPKKLQCSACNKQASGLTYICEPCNYSLHKTCSNMPQILAHQADTKHTLSLLPSPAYSDGAFQCDACGVSATGFCYHCKDCQLDLHPVCAFLPSSVKASSHHHPLKICFEPPYENKAFICDACGGPGSNHWLYRCGPCGFDSHLKCARATKIQHMDRKHESSTATVMKTRQTSSYQLQGYHSTVPVYATPQFLEQPRPGRNDMVQNVVNNLIEGIIEGAGNQIGQVLLQGALGN